MNRIDENVIFNSLSKKDLRGIVKLEIARLETRLGDRDITMSITGGALDFLADVGFDPVYGARPLKRTIQRELETTIAQGILRGEIMDGDSIRIDGDDDGIKVEILETGAAETSSTKSVVDGSFA